MKFDGWNDPSKMHLNVNVNNSWNNVFEGLTSIKEIEGIFKIYGWMWTSTWIFKIPISWQRMW
jgi:hypothetical protein